MKRGLNLAATTFVSASLVFGCVFTLSKQAGAKQTPVNSSDQSKSSQLIAQSCRDIEIRPNGNQDISFYKGTATARWVTTCNNYRFELQGDGNLVLYNSSNKPLWATGTVGRGYKLKVQGDGNVVLYDSNGQALWATMTNGNPGAFFSIQPDGNLVVYRLSDRRPLWYTATDGGRSRTLSASSEWLASRQSQPSQVGNNNPVKPLSSLSETIPTCLFNGPCVGGGSIHTGVDYFINSGSQVSAICDGVVTNAVVGGDIWNRFTIVKHSNCGGYQTLYAYYGHIDPNVKVGASVSKGQSIGTVGYYSPNNHHLHFGLSTQYFSQGWGYQTGNLEQKGWINPASFAGKFNW